MTMTKIEKMTKNDLMNELKKLNIEFNSKMTKNELIKLIEKNSKNNIENEIYLQIENAENEYENIIDNKYNVITINQNEILNQMHESIVNEKFEHFENVNENFENEQKISMFDEINNFCKNIDNVIINYIDDITIHLIANKKHVLIKIDNENEHSFVYTIIKTKNVDMKNARNILHLKSIRATKSYINCHTK